MFWKYFGYKQTHKGELETTFLVLFPFLIYVSKSRIMPGRACVWSLHLTPFIAIGLIGRCKKKSVVAE